MAQDLDFFYQSCLGMCSGACWWQDLKNTAEELVGSGLSNLKWFPIPQLLLWKIQACVCVR